MDFDGDVDSGDDAALEPSYYASLLPPGVVSDATVGRGIDNIIGYCGYVHNGESFVYTVRFRHYDPANGRWLERDPLSYADGMSLYGYVLGDPISLFDPSGLEHKPKKQSTGSKKKHHDKHTKPHSSKKTSKAKAKGKAAGTWKNKSGLIVIASLPFLVEDAKATSSDLYYKFVQFSKATSYEDAQLTAAEIMLLMAELYGSAALPLMSELMDAWVEARRQAQLERMEGGGDDGGQEEPEEEEISVGRKVETGDWTSPDLPCD